jgi:myosin-5
MLLFSPLALVARGCCCANSKRVLATNPLLEAFGNAKTARNDNSSRFGKLLKAQFTRSKGILTGACIVSYLLEKSRITRQSAEERNFHIFFQMCAALPEPARTALGVSASENFNYLASSVKVPSIDDVTDFDVRARVPPDTLLHHGFVPACVFQCPAHRMCR